MAQGAGQLAVSDRCQRHSADLRGAPGDGGYRDRCQRHSAVDGGYRIWHRDSDRDRSSVSRGRGDDDNGNRDGRVEREWWGK